MSHAVKITPSATKTQLLAVESSASKLYVQLTILLATTFIASMKILHMLVSDTASNAL